MTDLSPARPKVSFFSVISLANARDRATLVWIFVARLLVNVFDVLAMSAFMVFLLESSETQSSLVILVRDFLPPETSSPRQLLAVAIGIFALRSIVSVGLSGLFAAKVSKIEAEVSSRITLTSVKSQNSWGAQSEEFSKVQSSAILSCRRLFSEYLNTVFSIASEIVLLLLLGTLALIISPASFLWIAGGFIALGVLLKYVLGALSSRISNKIQSFDRDVYGVLESLHFGARDISSFSDWGLWERRFYKTRYGYAFWNAALRVLGTTPRHLIEIFLILGLGIFVFLSYSDQALFGTSTPLEIVALLALRFAGSVIPLQQALANLAAQKTGGKAAFEEAIGTHPHKIYKGPEMIANSSGVDTILFNLDYASDHSHDYSLGRPKELHLEQGKLYALVGASGSGKSTLLSSIANSELRQDLKVQVKMNRQLEDFSEHGAFLSAEPYFFLGSIVENVTMKPQEAIYGTEQEEKGRVTQALVLAGIWGEIVNQKMDIWKEMRSGGSLSTGQMQRVAIARAFYSGKKILLLDEPTSALDIKTEQMVLNGFRQYAKEKNAIFIYSAHRTQAIDFADEVIEIEKIR